MKKPARDGFILLIVIILLSLTATAFAILSATSATMVSHTRTAAIEANIRNLTASALAWAIHNNQKLKQQPAWPVQLETSALEINEATCRVQLKTIDNDSKEFEIEISLLRGKWQYSRKAGLDPDGFIYQQAIRIRPAGKKQPLVPPRPKQKTKISPHLKITDPNSPAIDPNDMNIQIIDYDTNSPNADTNKISITYEPNDQI